MATILNKNLTRESTSTIDGKEITITLTSDQEIELKLKGKRGGGKTIYIKDLYNQLYGLEQSDDDKKKGAVSVSNTPKKRGDGKMISLRDLRSHNAISMLDVPTLAKFDQIIKSVIDNQ
jgi:hypothetical protein|tara:strand:- start:21534 stop:21890 length:357 start_codon:yes stop_codon:yes gene_type:complete